MGATHIFDIGKAEELYWLAYEATLQTIKTDEKLQKALTSPFTELARMSEN
jgi:NTE family protein